MNFLKQTIAVTLVNLRTIPQRLGSSGVAIVGIAGVVIVLVSVLSIAQGFAAAMEASGSPVRMEPAGKSSRVPLWDAVTVGLSSIDRAGETPAMPARLAD